MITCESILHIEAHYSLIVAILSPTFLVPEQAFLVLDKGNKNNRSWDQIIPEMLIMKDEGIAWKDIADAFGYSVKSAQSMVSKWRKKQLEKEVAVVKNRPAQRKDITKEDVAAMVRMKENMTYKQIGAIYGMGPDAIYTRIRRYKGII